MRAYRGVILALVFLAFAVPATAQSMAGGRMNEGMAAFGGSLAVVEGDVLIGEPINTFRSGTVYVYRKTGANWREATQLTASDGKSGDGFGAAMAVDGQLLLVGATRQNENRGVVYAFQRNGNAWRESGRLEASDVSPNDGFGSPIVVRGDLALVGAPNQNRGTGAVYVFRRSASGWAQAAKLTSTESKERTQFGLAFTISGDAILVGEPGANDNAGLVRVFRADASGAYAEAGKVVPAGLQARERFGAPITTQDDVVLIGASSAVGGGAVFYYRVHNTPTGPEAPSPAIGPGGGAVVAGFREFRRLASFEGARTDGFGSSLAISGSDLWVGAPRTQSGRGAIYRYARTGTDSILSGVERVMMANAEPNDAFGGNVAVKGSVAAVTMTSDDYGAGTVVIYERSNNVWREQIVVKSPLDRMASVVGRKVECSDGKASGFECRDYDLMSFLSITDMGGARGVRLSGNWGWTDAQTGKEYALIGRTDGTSFVDVSNPEKPVYIGDLPRTKNAAPTSWREIKTYKNWALIVSDGSGPHGIQFFDLTRLRNAKAPARFEADYTYDKLGSIHNIVVNEEAGLAAAVGANGGGETCGGGLHMLDIKDPKNPTFVGCFADGQTGRAATGYSHDALCLNYRGPDKDYQGREICLGSNETKLSIADVTDKKAPKAIARAGYPNVGYTHQGWYDAEQRYFYMNDELDETGGLVRNTRTIIWDLADLDDPQVVGEFMGTTQASDHNLYVVGNLMYQSNYMAGLRVIDISDRKNPVEVGFFDTVPYSGNTPGFGGSWNNYPFFKSGNVIISSGAEGLFMVRKKGPKIVSD